MMKKIVFGFCCLLLMQSFAFADCTFQQPTDRTPSDEDLFLEDPNGYKNGKPDALICGDNGCLDGTYIAVKGQHWIGSDSFDDEKYYKCKTSGNDEWEPVSNIRKCADGEYNWNHEYGFDGGWTDENLNRIYGDELLNDHRRIFIYTCIETDKQKEDRIEHWKVCREASVLDDERLSNEEKVNNARYTLKDMLEDIRTYNIHQEYEFDSDGDIIKIPNTFDYGDFTDVYGEVYKYLCKACDTDKKGYTVEDAKNFLDEMKPLVEKTKVTAEKMEKEVADMKELIDKAKADQAEQEQQAQQAEQERLAQLAQKNALFAPDCPSGARKNDACSVNPSAKTAKCMDLGKKDSNGNPVLTCTAWECNGTHYLYLNLSGKSQGVCHEKSYAESFCKRNGACTGCSKNQDCVPNLKPTPRTNAENGAYMGCHCADKTANQQSGNNNGNSSNNNNGNQNTVVNQPVKQKDKATEEKAKSAHNRLQAFFNNNKADVWKDAEGKFNTARLASDLTAGVVLGTVGGVVSGVVIKKKQVEKGFDALHCAVGGQTVADWGDEFIVGMSK